MNLIRWQPVDEMMGLTDLLTRTFRQNSFPGETSTPKLSLDIYETEEELVVRATLPGAKKEDFTVEFEGQMLTIAATVNEPELPEGANSLLRESVYGRVGRSFRIPHRLDVDNSKGSFVDGVLEVTFPKSSESRRRTITIE